MNNFKFKADSVSDVQRGLASLYPNDKVFEAKVDSSSNLYSLLLGYSYELFREEYKVEQIMSNLFLTYTVQLIDRWENALGIPSTCFSTEYDLPTRITNALSKFKARGVSTAKQFVALAAFLGYAIVIIPASTPTYIFPPYQVPFYPFRDLASARFIWIIEGENLVTGVPPYNVPFKPNDNASLLECFFQELKPANTILIFQNSIAP